jgi:hypothetical protein
MPDTRVRQQRSEFDDVFGLDKASVGEVAAGGLKITSMWWPDSYLHLGESCPFPSGTAPAQLTTLESYLSQDAQ